jgi:thioredoxin-related protein
MRIATLIIILLYLPCIIFGKVNFFEGSLNDVQRTAALEGKLYFIDFYAAYCLPCKLMDQTTFMDLELGEYVKRNYVPLKLNIEAFDAYEVRNKHEVKALPTVMIFSSSGELLESYEGSLTASKLKEILERHNTPKNRQKIAPPAAESSYTDEVTIPSRKPVVTSNVPPNKPERKQEQVMTTKPVITVPTSPNKPTSRVSETVVTITKPTTSTLSSGMDNIIFEKEENPNPTFNRVILKPTKPILSKPKFEQVEEVKPEIVNVAPSRPVSILVQTQPQPKTKVIGLYEFRVTPHPAKGFAIQIGIFAEYGNVLNEVERIQKLFPERKVIVHIDEMSGKTVYRVAVGTFTSSIAARNFIPQIKVEGFEGFVKDLSTLN